MGALSSSSVRNVCGRCISRGPKWNGDRRGSQRLACGQLRARVVGRRSRNVAVGIAHVRNGKLASRAPRDVGRIVSAVRRPQEHVIYVSESTDRCEDKASPGRIVAHADQGGQMSQIERYREIEVVLHIRAQRQPDRVRTRPSRLRASRVSVKISPPGGRA